MALMSGALIAACAPSTSVVLENDFPAGEPSKVIYQAFWQAVPFQTPIPPGQSSEPQSTVPASANSAYVVLAPGWDPSSTTPPTSFVVLQSRSGVSVELDGSLHILVDDTTFAGDCAAGSFLTQQQAEFITRRVFQNVFQGLTYDASTCTTSAAP
jgi:hypothetical protein